MSPELAAEIDLLAQDFPKHELYSLSSQVKRAANSVSLNIVEGSTVLSNAECRRFSLCPGSVGCLFLAKRRKYIAAQKFNELYERIEVLVRTIQSTINSLKD